MIDLRVSAHIPEEYIQNLTQRIDIYKKIAAIGSDEDARDVIDALIDRDVYKRQNGCRPRWKR